MATTTNFGWETPDDTDLVKDGALAIRTLGSAIDTSLVDLKGGTTGQVLAKASNTDMDFTWSSVDPLTILDAKGDLITATAADTPARLAVGTNGQVLTVDSTTSTGLKWATAASGVTLVGAQATLSSEQTISNNTWTAVGFNTETYGFDTNSFHDNSTNNSRFTIPSGKGGYYLIMGQGEMASTTSYNQRSKIVLNGSTDISCGLANTWSTNGDHTFYSQTVYNLAAGDYVEFHVFQNSGANRQLQSNLSFPGITKMTLIKVGD